MAYEMVMPYHLHMPSYFLETFTEYPISSLALTGKKGSNGCSSIFNKDFIKSLMIILLALVLF